MVCRITRGFLRFVNVRIMRKRSCALKSRLRQSCVGRVFGRATHGRLSLSLGRGFVSRHPVEIIKFYGSFGLHCVGRHVRPFTFCVKKFTCCGCLFIHAVPTTSVRRIGTRVGRDVTGLKSANGTSGVGVASVRRRLDSGCRRRHGLGLLVAVFSLVSVYVSLVKIFNLMFFRARCHHHRVTIHHMRKTSVGDVLVVFIKRCTHVILITFLFTVPINCVLVSH